MVAVIELEEGPRILSTVTEIPALDVVCDMLVKVVFDDVVPDVTIPKFAPC